MSNRQTYLTIAFILIAVASWISDCSTIWGVSSGEVCSCSDILRDWGGWFRSVRWV